MTAIAELRLPVVLGLRASKSAPDTVVITNDYL